jgi:hypothetical protein
LKSKIEKDANKKVDVEKENIKPKTQLFEIFKYLDFLTLAGKIVFLRNFLKTKNCGKK